MQLLNLKMIQTKENLHTLILLMENKLGVLNRVVSLIRNRRFNIESLNVGHSEKEGISRLTVVVDGTNIKTEQIIKQLYKIISVLKVYDITENKHLQYELALIKITLNKTQLLQIKQIAEMFDARVVDISNDSAIIQITSQTLQIDSLIEMLKEFGIQEMVRTGITAMKSGK
jgi:acetolactate synthase-1/3 small subunit